jgi:hypothetical protein
MDAMSAVRFLFKVIVLGLAILMVIFGLVPDILDSEGQQFQFQSPEGYTMPEEGYISPVYDPLTSFTVEVRSDRNVEVHLHNSNYRGGKLVKDAYNNTVIRDEWLVAGEVDQRRGTDVVLKDFTASSSQYIVIVAEPGSSVPSDASYTIIIEATSINMTLIVAGLVFFGLFYLIGIYDHLSSIRKAGVPMKTMVDMDDGMDEWERS